MTERVGYSQYWTPPTASGSVVTAAIYKTTAQTFADHSCVAVDLDEAYGGDPDGYVTAPTLTIPTGKAGRFILWGQARISIGTDGATPIRTDVIGEIYRLSDFRVLAYWRFDWYVASNETDIVLRSPPVDLDDGDEIGLFVCASGNGAAFSGSTGTGGTDAIGYTISGIPFTFLALQRLGDSSFVS